MATPADQRLLELLDKWLKSLELHLKYSSLDNDSYSSVQPWPEHQRPSRWIIELARQKALALQAQLRERVQMGDAQFSESVELMAFLANLVGAEHIERFIPLAHAETERPPSTPSPQSRDPQSGRPQAARPQAADTRAAQASATGTREMPKFVPGRERTREPAGTAGVARTERRAQTERRTQTERRAHAERRAQPRSQAKPPENPPDGTAAGADLDPRMLAMREQVIADAARLVQWGRKWYELAELISSMANRPSLIDVRRILKDNKTVIDKKAGRS